MGQKVKMLDQGEKVKVTAVDVYWVALYIWLCDCFTDSVLINILWGSF